MARAFPAYHVFHLSLAGVKKLHDAVGMFVRNFYVHRFIRFRKAVVFIPLHDHGGTGNAQFIIFTAHSLHQHGDLHGAAGGNGENAGLVRILHLDGNIRPHFPHQAVAYHAGSHILAVAPSERPVVDGKFHGNGRRINRHEWKGLRIRGTAQGFPDIDVFKPRHPYDVACHADGRIRSAQAGIFKHAGHFSGNAGAVALMEPHGIPFLHSAGSNAADSHTAHIIVPVNIGNEHLEFTLRIGILRSGDMFHNLE